VLHSHNSNALKIFVLKVFQTIQRNSVSEEN